MNRDITQLINISIVVLAIFGFQTSTFGSTQDI
jgi:hypothetical protein